MINIFLKLNKSKMKKILFSFLLLITLFSCQGQRNKNFDQIEYRFSDSSVEARFHRSYKINIAENGKGKLYIYVYGDTLIQKDFEVSKSDFEELKKLSQEIESAGTKVNKEMSGTSTQSIKFLQENKEVYQLTWDNKAKVSEATERFVFHIKKYTPELQELLAIEHDVHTSIAGQETETKEQLEILELKQQLFDNHSGDKDLKKERNVLFEIWGITYKPEIVEGDTSPNIGLGLSIKDQNGNNVHINNRQQGHTVQITLRARDRENDEILWTIEFDYIPLDMDNVSVLMME